jgi:hypothetical protein
MFEITSMILLLKSFAENEDPASHPLCTLGAYFLDAQEGC